MWKLPRDFFFCFLQISSLRGNFFFSYCCFSRYKGIVWGWGGGGEGGGHSETFQTEKAAVLECALAYERARGNDGPRPWLKKNKIDAICRACSF